MLHRLDDAVERFDAVTVRLGDPEVARDPDRLRDLGRERSELEPIARTAGELREALAEWRGARELTEGTDDSEMRALAEAEVIELEARLEGLADRALRLLVPKDPLAARDAVLEIRAGTGGDEAGLFAADLLRMYRRFAESQRWTVELIDLSEGIPGSVREAVVTVRGDGAYGALRFESGVHRVQRVPETESQGRIHTSAATVAVLPEAEEVEVSIDPSELRIDVFRSSGPGGQSVNTTDSAVRITHLPTGLVVTCQDEKSQLKNRNKAMKVLRSRLLDREIAEREAERARDRKAQVGTGDRSAKIRTYNFPQNRVTDHRIGLTLHQLDQVLEGELTPVLDALRLADEEERLEELM
ncbi:MAG: peptide chain release factor 1 [Gemmatimonadales bacterium]|nr:MAG: peptide chain release factor 1 [Gemmatimonadales bacterium]